MISFGKIMGSHYSPFTIWAKTKCLERGLGELEKLSPEVARQLKTEFDRHQKPPPEVEKPKDKQGVP